MSSNSEIKKGAFFSYVAVIVNTIAVFLYTPWMINQIGAADYGLYSLALSLVGFFLFDFGLASVVSRYISLYRAKKQPEEISKLLGIVAKIYILIDLIVLIVLLFIYFNIEKIYVEMSLAEIEKLKRIFLIIMGFSLLSFPLIPVSDIYIGYERFANIKIFNFVGKITTILTIILALCFGGGVYILVLVNMISNLVIKLAEFVYIKKKEKFRINIGYYDSEYTKKIFCFSIWITIIGISQRLIININPSIIGALSGAIEVSIFSVGASIEGHVWSFANAINGLFLPKVTRISVSENPIKELDELMIRVGRIQLIVVGGIITGLLALGREFVFVWMGEEFLKSYYVSLCLILPGFITLTQEVAMSYLIAINEVKWRAIDFVGTAVISLLLSVCLSPKYGALGAAMAVFIGLTLGHVVFMNIIYVKRFKMGMIAFFKECHLKFLPVMIIMILAGILMQRFLPVGGFLIFFSKAAVWGIIYLVLVWIAFLNQYEKNFFKNILRPIISRLKRG